MKSRGLQLLISWVAFILTITIAWLIGSWIIRTIFGLDKALASAIIAAFVAVFSAIFAYWKEREKSRQEAHKEKKVEVYSIFFDIVFKILKASKGESNDQAYYESQELQDSLFELMKGILAYGSPAVVLSMGRWRLAANSNSSAQLLHVGDILLAMREDLGLSNRGLNNINIHQIYVVDDIEIALKGVSK